MANKQLMYSAAIFNWLIAIAFTAAPNLVYTYLLSGEPPAGQAMLYLFAGLVFVFGIGYFWAGRNFESNISIVKLGIIGKLTVFAIALITGFLGLSTMLFLAAAFVDFIYALLFIRAVRKYLG